jgi:hypothetical protein
LRIDSRVYSTRRADPHLMQQRAAQDSRFAVIRVVVDVIA